MTTKKNTTSNNTSLDLKKYPMVSICTPTFNRRPFLPYIIKCFENQTYPKERMEWIIVDDGTDKVEDIFINVPRAKYYRYDTKLYLGKKRNIANEKCSGDIIVYMDDDDYYPPDRVSHAVETLQKNPQALCAGSSEMYLYFKHIHKMYQFGPYGPNHATAATFAFRRELLNITRYDETAALAEEKHFLKNYTIPFVQLDPMKCILVFSHVHNSFDKKTLLDQGGNNPYVKISDKKIEDFVNESDVKQFFMEDIDILLDNYFPGKPENKPDVLKQIEEIKEKREEMIRQQQTNLNQYNDILRKLNIEIDGAVVKNQKPMPDGKVAIDPLKKINEMNMVINELMLENNQLKDKVKYFEEKIKKIICEQIETKKKLVEIEKKNVEMRGDEIPRPPPSS
jgi:glycosyltransferase involved in cell wall biosynthesis